MYWLELALGPGRPAVHAEDYRLSPFRKELSNAPKPIDASAVVAPLNIITPLLWLPACPLSREKARFDDVLASGAKPIAHRAIPLRGPDKTIPISAVGPAS